MYKLSHGAIEGLDKGWLKQFQRLDVDTGPYRVERLLKVWIKTNYGGFSPLSSSSRINGGSLRSREPVVYLFGRNEVRHGEKDDGDDELNKGR